MTEIRFDLGKNIAETAKASGVPKFDAREVAGLVSYSVADIPREVAAHLTRKDHEVVWTSLFAFTMSSDRDRDPNLSVESVRLQHRMDFATDAAAQAFVEQTIAQFAKGQWRRYADPDWDVLLTGRSSILDEAGQLQNPAMTIDPAYKIPAEDWAKLVRNGPNWRWVGDGIFAQLAVRNSPAADGKPAYQMTLEFELLDAMLKRNADNAAKERRAGDAKGWNSSAEYEADKKARAEQIKRQIANAIRRGDSVAAQH